jgi:hypothetical protein
MEEVRGHMAHVLAITTTVALLLAGCGSSSSKSSTSAPATTSASAPATTTAASAPATTATASPAATTASAAGSAKFDSCSVVTRNEAADAIGQSVTAGVLGSATVEGGLACVFYGPSAPKPANPNVAQVDSVRVVVVKGPNAVTYYNDYKSEVKAQPISGYGNAAYYDGYASLSVLKGDYYVRIAVVPGGAPPSLPDEQKLATAILPKL